jgi:hypothetical protein
MRRQSKCLNASCLSRVHSLFFDGTRNWNTLANGATGLTQKCGGYGDQIFPCGNGNTACSREELTVHRESSVSLSVENSWRAYPRCPRDTPTAGDVCVPVRKSECATEARWWRCGRKPMWTGFLRTGDSRRRLGNSEKRYMSTISRLSGRGHQSHQESQSVSPFGLGRSLQLRCFAVSTVPVNKEVEEKMKRIPVENIRNFCIVAHVDHGKSTLSDRILQMTGTLPKDASPQYLDKLGMKKRTFRWVLVEYCASPCGRAILRLERLFTVMHDLNGMVRRIVCSCVPSTIVVYVVYISSNFPLDVVHDTKRLNC